MPARKESRRPGGIQGGEEWVSQKKQGLTEERRVLGRSMAILVWLEPRKREK